MPTRIDILLSDAAFLAVNKPAGVPTIPGRQGGGSVRDMLAQQRMIEELFIVHRLDKDTSGVLLLARTADAHRQLSEQFFRRRVEKSYLALVKGSPDQDFGVVDAPLTRDQKSALRMIVHAKSGKPSRTRWEVVERFGGITLVRCRPLTGRQHQIRVHMAHIGLPLLVDRLYAGTECFLLSQIKAGYKRSKGEEERPILARLSLHAESLVFSHPQSGELLSVEAPLPKDFRAVLNQLRRNQSRN